MEGSNVGFITNLGARNHLDEIYTLFPCVDNLRRSQCSREHDHVLFHCELDQPRMQSTIAGEKLCSRVKALTCDSRVRHTARPHDDMGSVLHKVRNDLGGPGHGQGDFYDGNSMTSDRLGGKKGIVRRVDANGGDDTGFLNPAPHLVFLHLVVSFACTCRSDTCLCHALSAAPVPLTLCSVRPGQEHCAERPQHHTPPDVGFKDTLAASPLGT